MLKQSHDFGHEKDKCQFFNRHWIILKGYYGINVIIIPFKINSNFLILSILF